MNDEFSYRHGDFHYSKHKLTEVIPNEKVLWLTLDSKLTFVEKQDKWNGTERKWFLKSQSKDTKRN